MFLSFEYESYKFYQGLPREGIVHTLKSKGRLLVLIFLNLSFGQLDDGGI